MVERWSESAAVLPLPASEDASIQIGSVEGEMKPRSRWVVPLALVVAAGIFAVVSNGFLEADETSHFLVSRGVWEDKASVLSIWGRLGCTGYYALGAAIGLWAARLQAVLVTALVGVGATMVMRQLLPAARGGDGAMGRRSWLARHAEAMVWLLLFAQPCFAMNSFTVMTEMPLACAWIWSAAILLRGRGRRGGGIVLAGLVLGLGGLVRPEGWIAIAVWPAFLWLWLRSEGGVGSWGRMVASAIAAGLPTLGWYLLGVLAYGDGVWPIHQWPWPVKSPYAHTGVLFLVSMAGSMAVWMWAPMIAGAWPLWVGFFRRAGTSAHATRDGEAGNVRAAFLLLVAPVGGVFILHGTLGVLGLLGSMSLPRYFICIAPMAAILAFFGLLRFEAWFKPRAARRFAMTAAAVPVLTLAALCAAGFLPSMKSVTLRRMDVGVARIRELLKPADYNERLILGHPYPMYALGYTRMYSRGDLAEAPRGSVLLLDAALWNREGRASAEQLEAWGYREDAALGAQADAIGAGFSVMDQFERSSRIRLWIKQ